MMQTINTAPRDGILVYVMAASKPEFGKHLMGWNTTLRMWTGKSFGPMGARTTYWDEKAAPVTHWEPYVA